MGIEFNSDSVNRYLKLSVLIVHEEVKKALSFLGEQCVTRVRDRTGDMSWYDQTGNLRSSIQYAIYEDGKKTIESSFPQVLSGSDGVYEAHKLITELAGLYATTFALVVVAGMNYADVVEALENKDVLATTELWAKKEIDRFLKLAKERAIRRIKSIK